MSAAMPGQAAHYRMLPVDVEARQFAKPVDIGELARWCGGEWFFSVGDSTQYIVFPESDGHHRADLGDWIVKRLDNGEFYPVKPGDFKAAYEAVAAQEPQATPGQADNKPFRWEGTMAEFDAEVRRRWAEASEGLTVAEALGACVVELRAVLADAPPAQPVLGDIPDGIMPSGGERNARELLDAKRTCGHKYKLGGGTYICEREPHPTGGYGPAFRHASYGPAVTPENGEPDGE